MIDYKTLQPVEVVPTTGLTQRDNRDKGALDIHINDTGIAGNTCMVSSSSMLVWHAARYFNIPDLLQFDASNIEEFYYKQIQEFIKKQNIREKRPKNNELHRWLGSMHKDFINALLVISGRDDLECVLETSSIENLIKVLQSGTGAVFGTWAYMCGHIMFAMAYRPEGLGVLDPFGKYMAIPKYSDTNVGVHYIPWNNVDYLLGTDVGAIQQGRGRTFMFYIRKKAVKATTPEPPKQEIKTEEPPKKVSFFDRIKKVFHV